MMGFQWGTCYESLFRLQPSDPSQVGLVAWALWPTTMDGCNLL